MNCKIDKNSDVLDVINAWSVRQKVEATVIMLIQASGFLFLVLFPVVIAIGIIGLILHKFGIL